MRQGSVMKGFVALVAVMLAGCADPQLASLDRELAQIRSDPGAAPALELPAVPRIEGIGYDLEEQRSPFVMRDGEAERALPEGTLVMPQLDRQREPLEAYDLSELQLVGTLRVGGQPSALVRAPGGQVHRLSVGNYLGLNHGRIVSITETSLLLVELHVERGAWVERNRQMALDT
ncbi:pilus assembly protein PilP [Halomonas mongoliensis]|uniref:pilus assembly protein PilP n=1 Tax=Halomonas mongoliensis TaxID=321265 RepID=UPI00403B3616